jgi:PhnB protein
MPKRSSAEQLDRAIEAMLISLPPEPEQHPDVRLVQLMPIVRILRELPRPNFKEALKIDLQRRSAMNAGSAASGATGTGSARTPHFVRPGFNNIAPYILVKGAARFVDFLKAAFEGTERIRVPQPDGSIMHCEIGIGDSVIELGDANEQHPPRPTTVHLYVDDADATFERALRAGATSIYPVADQHWGDRQGSAKDEFGNVWNIAMAKSWTPEPGGLRNVQPYLHLRDAHKMIPFAQAAFHAEALGVAKSEEGKVLHATIRIGSGTFEIDEASDESQPMPCYLHIYVPDSDACYEDAVRAGATSVEPPNDKPYGERSATVNDLFGNTWFLATYLGSSI